MSECVGGGASSEPRTFMPEDGWTQWGCETCGRVHLFPADRDERPWCTHSSLTWPVSDEQAEQMAEHGWVTMVPVRVVEQQSGTEGEHDDPCLARSPDEPNYVCTRQTGHAGRHEAWTPMGAVAVWEPEVPPESPEHQPDEDSKAFQAGVAAVVEVLNEKAALYLQPKGRATIPSTHQRTRAATVREVRVFIENHPRFKAAEGRTER